MVVSAARFLAGVGLVCVVAGSGRSATAADAAAPVIAQPAPAAWSATLNTEFRYASWSSDRGFPLDRVPLGGGGRGAQFYVPTAINVSGQPPGDWQWNFTTRAGYVTARQSTAGAEGSVSTATDTQVSGTATFTGLNGLQPYLSLMLNLPTGRSALYGNARFARMDPDLVDVPTYGEGFNAGPTAGVNIPITTSLLASLSVGYTYRGPFDREGLIDPVTLLQPTDRVNPGDVVTGTATLGYVGNSLLLQGSFSYAVETQTTINGIPLYRAGERFMVTGSAGYTWSPSWASSVNAFWNHGNRNEVLNAGLGVLVTEAFNTNTDVFRINAEHTYTSGALSIGPVASFLRRFHNSWDPIRFAFVPAKTRWSLGGSGQYKITDSIAISMRVEHLWIQEDESPDKVLNGVIIPGTGLPALSSEGWIASIGAIAKLQ
jgi:hypothetical protein